MSRKSEILGLLKTLHQTTEPKSILFVSSEPFYIHVEEEYADQEIAALRSELADLKGRVQRLKDLRFTSS